MRISVLVAALCLAIVGLSTATESQASIRKHTSIPAQGLGPALQTLAQDHDFQIVFVTEDLKDLHTQGAAGELTRDEALNALLSGTGLTFRYVDDNTVTVTLTTKTGASDAIVLAAPVATRSIATDLHTTSRIGPEVRLAQVQSDSSQSQSQTADSKREDTPTSSSENARTNLQEVIVTAARRESTLQKTPISISVVSGAEIQERGLTSLSSIAQSVPGVSMRTTGPGQTEFEMRGMASTGGNSPTVGFYLDDVPLTSPANSSNGKVVIDPNLYDLNRIEVLRGPQGTLYGSGSMGGTIRVITNPPNPEAFDLSAETVVGNTDGGGANYGANAMLNIPMSGGSAALRIVGSGSHTSGWIDRIVIADGEFPLATNDGAVRGNVLAAPVAAKFKDVNDADIASVRSTLLWTPTDRLTISPSYYYQQIAQEGGGHPDTDPGTNAHYQPFDAPEPFSDYFNLGSLNVQYRFDRFDLTSTTSYYTRSVTYRQDGAEEWQWALGLPSYYASEGGLGPTSPTPLEREETEQTAEELRLTSSGDSRFQWLLGFYYADFTSNQIAEFLTPEAEPLFGTTNLFTFFTPSKIKQNSVFSELSYQLTPQVKVLVGARRYSYDGSVHTAYSGAVATGSDEVATFSTSESSDGVNPKFSLSYEPTDNLTLYSTIAKGFRPGGGTGPIPTAAPLGDVCEANLQAIYDTTEFVPSPSAFGSDDVWNYEIGEKMQAFENRLTINSAAYFAQWNGIQQVIPLPCGYNFTANAGDAEVYGGEVELQAVLTDGLILYVNGGYTHATIKSSNVRGVGVDPGTPIQNVPDWTSSVALVYRRSILGDLTFTSRVENNYVGSRTDATFAINHLPSYTLTSLRMGIEKERHWSAVLFVTNLFNEAVVLNNVTQINVNPAIYNRVATAQPLTVGVDFSWQFGNQ